jgi:hypothetical protein
MRSIVGKPHFKDSLAAFLNICENLTPLPVTQEVSSTRSFQGSGLVNASGLPADSTQGQLQD